MSWISTTGNQPNKNTIVPVIHEIIDDNGDNVEIIGLAYLDAQKRWWLVDDKDGEPISPRLFVDIPSHIPVK